MALKPQDVLVLLKLAVVGQRRWTFNRLAVELEMSPSEVHAATKRALAAQLAVKREEQISPNLGNLEEFLVHGIRYVFYPQWGELTRGMPTLQAGQPLQHRMAPSDEPAPVWPDPDGTVRGVSFAPLYKSVPSAARADQALYELLVLVDALRAGGTRLRQLARVDLAKRLTHAKRN